MSEPKEEPQTAKTAVCATPFDVRRTLTEPSRRNGLRDTREFSRRYAASPRSLQKWEQGRRRRESAVRPYLTVIDRNPKAVEKPSRTSREAVSRCIGVSQPYAVTGKRKV
jgi:DNA-binding transcriptional regulator YiaG